jgi:hypothetical protein
MPAKICLNCEKPFRPKPYRAARARFCSREYRSSISLDKKLLIVGWMVSPSGCWLCNCRTNDGGYGLIGHDDRAVLAHRASWMVHRGPIPDGIDVLHTCDVRPCINPDHLFLGTDADNVADMDAKGRRYVLRGEENGYSVLTEDQVSDILSRPRVFGSGRDLAIEFNVSQSTISLIRLGKVWKHVAR